MNGRLEVCHHNQDGTQNSKKITTINTKEEEKSFHLVAKYGDKEFLVSFYCDTIGVADITNQTVQAADNIKLLWSYTIGDDDGESVEDKNKIVVPTANSNLDC